MSGRGEQNSLRGALQRGGGCPAVAIMAARAPRRLHRYIPHPPTPPPPSRACVHDWSIARRGAGGDGFRAVRWCLQLGRGRFPPRPRSGGGAWGGGATAAAARRRQGWIDSATQGFGSDSGVVPPSATCTGGRVAGRKSEMEGGGSRTDHEGGGALWPAGLCLRGGGALVASGGGASDGDGANPPGVRGGGGKGATHARGDKGGAQRERGRRRRRPSKRHLPAAGERARASGPLLLGQRGWSTRPPCGTQRPDRTDDATKRGVQDRAKEQGQERIRTKKVVRVQRLVRRAAAVNPQHPTACHSVFYSLWTHTHSTQKKGKKEEEPVDSAGKNKGELARERSRCGSSV